MGNSTPLSEEEQFEEDMYLHYRIQDSEDEILVLK